MNPIAEILALFRERGSAAYFGEQVSELEHALQTAALAQAENAPAPLLAAALLHDLGHLLHQLPENCAALGLDAGHEKVGADWLAQYFLPSVSEPVRLHVAAKRYLCAAQPGYLEKLSPASQQSLALQGGPLNPIEAAEFQQLPHFRAALRLRCWDEAAKVPGLAVPELESYRALLVSLVY
jgi:phosphonate degradation associated HDIG domain protein